MNQAAVVASLSVLLSDILNQVSTTRLQAAVNEAWNDGWVATPVWDSTSLIFTVGQYQYALPSTMTRVDAIYIERSATSLPEEISTELYEVVNGKIQFTNKAQYKIPTGYQLYLRGQYKLTASDSIPATALTLQNYVTTLAASIVLKQMAFTKVLSFLHNDTTLQEVIAFRNQLQQDVLGYRSQLQSSYTNA